MSAGNSSLVHMGGILTDGEEQPETAGSESAHCRRRPTSQGLDGKYLGGMMLWTYRYEMRE